MELSNLKPAAGSIKSRKRIARGEGSGRGGTSTRGYNGQKSRSGYSKKFGFEGGQMPLQRRVPKFGFKNFNRVEYAVVNLSDLQAFADKFKLKKFDLEIFKKHKSLAKGELIKVLAKGDLKAKLEVHAHAFSDSAKKAIEEQGGKVVNL
jgi:large subunit ribosomal protein L15